ncbi:MAG TPA: lactate utilization protein [Candidatus Methanoperedenaceae archaeon]|nr:lactate utilization protein [Candidatus Methanoperedenaceae archaeon]
MNPEEVLALKKAFSSVLERQSRNQLADLDEKKRRLKAARELCVGNRALLDEAAKKLTANGFRVYFASEKDEACELILREMGDEKHVVKSKSNVTKEIELAAFLGEKGINVVETDIGDRILQVLELHPSHPTAPIAHVSAKSISRRFNEMGVKVGGKPEDIVGYVREDVIQSIGSANIGITGANAITVEEGAVVITHNEGNIFEVARRKKHIVVTSTDKIYPNLEEAMNMLKVLSYNATGATIPSFVEVISGVSKTADVEKKFIKGVHNPHEVVVIILDNKRSEIARNGFRELLYCIGCGNCLMHCPMYNVVGTEYAQDSHLGGRGLAFHSLSNGSSSDKLKCCLMCGKCREACPVDIDVPKIIRELRSKGISDEVYYFLRAHLLWACYRTVLAVSRGHE